jgi:uncharacterized protein
MNNTPTCHSICANAPPDDVHGSFNFSCTPESRQGRPYIARQTSMKGDYVELLALTDVLALPNMCSANIKASIARM